MENREPHWYALAVHSRQERAAAKAIEKQGLEVLLPIRRERHAWSDRIKNVESALFPGYLLICTKMSAKQRTDLLKVRQTLDLVGRLPGDDRIARHIPDEQIESLKTLTSSSYNLDPVERLVKGATVLVAAGPLKGARGIIEKTAGNKRRLIVQIELLGRGVSTELNADDVVEAAGSNP